MKASISVFILLSGLIINMTTVEAQQVSLKNSKKISQIIALASCGPWETIRQDQGVDLKSRWLYFGDTLKSREISSRFVVNAAMPDVLANLTHPERFRDWNDGVRSVSIVKRNDTSWVTHIVYDIPQPFSQQDLVIMHEMTTELRSIIIHMYAVPDAVPPLKNVTRQRFYFGQWEIRAINNTHTEVKFSAISFSQTNIPRFIRDPILQNKLMRSFIRLKEQSSKPIASF
jgi:hypothetical protein